MYTSLHDAFFAQDNLQLLTNTTNCHLYGLADHAGAPGLLAQLQRNHTPWRSLFDGAVGNVAIAAAPLLFALKKQPNRAEEKPLWHWLDKNARYTSSLLLIASPHDIDTLQLLLNRRLQALLEPDMPMLLRFYDPRIFYALMQVLTPEQQAAFLNIGEQWSWLNRHGNIETQSSKFQDDDAVSEPIVFTQTQQNLLLDLNEADQIAALLAQTPNPTWQHQSPGEQYDFIRRQQASAQHFGLHLTQDLALFCELALAYGEGFVHETKWQTALQQVSIGKHTLLQAISHAE